MPAAPCRGAIRPIPPILPILPIRPFQQFCTLCGLVIRWLVRHLNPVLREHKAEVNAHHQAMEKIIQTQNETSLKLAVCLDRNTAALSDCTYELRRFQEAA